MFKVPEKYRITEGPLGSPTDSGNNGYFIINKIKHRDTLAIIASDGFGWEHVSISTPYRCPTWEEMSEVKNLFWSEEDTVVQYHPPKSEYVNNHPYTLHLWRPIDKEILRPPYQLVGIINK